MCGGWSCGGRACLLMLWLAWPTVGHAWQRDTSAHGVALQWRGPVPAPRFTSPVPGLPDGGRGALEAAMAAWTAPTCTSLRFVPGGAPSPDNEIVWIGSGWPHGGAEAAYTTVRSVPETGEILGGRIELNGQLGFAGPNGRGGVDLQQVLIHELGHLLGLGHSRRRDALMFAGIRPGAGAVHALGRDDVQAICAVYARPSTPAVGGPRAASVSSASVDGHRPEPSDAAKGTALGSSALLGGILAALAFVGAGVVVWRRSLRAGQSPRA